MTNQTMLITGPWKKKRRLVDESVDKVQPGTDHWIEVEEEEEEDDTVNIEGEATENGGVEYVEEEDRNAFKFKFKSTMMVGMARMTRITQMAQMAQMAGMAGMDGIHDPR